VFGSCSADVGELVMAVVDMLPHSARAKALVPGTGQVVFEGVDAAEPAFGHTSAERRARFLPIGRDEVLLVPQLLRVAVQRLGTAGAPCCGWWPSMLRWRVFSQPAGSCCEQVEAVRVQPAGSQPHLATGCGRCQQQRH
jgi:hypothetical protein